MRNSVTLRTVARALGVSATTVSLALRNSRELPAATRQRIRRTADSMGYRQDPKVRAWLASRRNPAAEKGEVLTYLNPYPTEELWRASASITRFYDGAKARAIQLGFQWDELWFRRLGLTQKRLESILKARGIRGLIVGSFPEAQAALNLDWPHYVAIAQGLTLIRPDLPRACNNYYDTMLVLLRQLVKLGYRRPGLYIANNSNERCRNIWQAAYLVFHSTNRSMKPVPSCIPETSDLLAFEKWYRRNRPDVILACDVYVRTWLKEMGLATPGDVGFASFDCHPTAKWRGASGMDHRIEVCGAAAVDFIAGRLSRNESGLAPIPETIMTPAVWKEGETLRKAS